MADITILSLNVNGLQSVPKRCDSLNFIYRKKLIIFLQEMLSSPKSEQLGSADLFP